MVAVVIGLRDRRARIVPRTRPEVDRASGVLISLEADDRLGIGENGGRRGDSRDSREWRVLVLRVLSRGEELFVGDGLIAREVGGDDAEIVRRIGIQRGEYDVMALAIGRRRGRRGIGSTSHRRVLHLTIGLLIAHPRDDRLLVGDQCRCYEGEYRRSMVRGSREHIEVAAIGVGSGIARTIGGTDGEIVMRPDRETGNRLRMAQCKHWRAGHRRRRYECVPHHRSRIHDRCGCRSTRVPGHVELRVRCRRYGHPGDDRPGEGGEGIPLSSIIVRPDIADSIDRLHLEIIRGIGCEISQRERMTADTA